MPSVNPNLKNLLTLVAVIGLLIALPQAPAVAADGQPVQTEANMCLCPDDNRLYNEMTDTGCPRCKLQCKQTCVEQKKTKPEQNIESRPLQDPLKIGATETTIPEFLGRVIRLFTGVVGSLALLMFVYGGFLMLTSRGEAEKIEKGKKIFTYSTLGLIIIFGAYAILRTLFETIGAA